MAYAVFDVKQDEIDMFCDIVSAYKNTPVPSPLIAERMGMNPRRVQTIAKACVRVGIPVLSSPLGLGAVDNTSYSGYTIGGKVERSNPIKVGDKIEVWDAHFEDNDCLPKYWKRFDVVAENDYFYTLETEKGIKTSLLKVDIYDGHVRLEELK